MAPWYSDYDFWSAAGTVAAVVLALAIVLGERVASWWRRPILEVTYENKMPWRRWARISGTGNQWDLFFRIAVKNRGLTTARSVRAQLEQWLTPDGLANPYLDPFMLHWVGTEYARRDGVDLLPGQTEYVDVFLVPTNGRSVPLDGLQYPQPNNQFLFVIIPQCPVPRGITNAATFDRQQLRIVIAGENVAATSVTWTLPGPHAKEIPSSEIRVLHSKVETGSRALVPLPTHGIVGVDEDASPVERGSR